MAIDSRPERVVFCSNWSFRLVDMRKVQAAEAKTHLFHILDEVENGESIQVTRRGKRVARIIPDMEIDDESVLRAMEEMKALRKRIGRLSLEEILSARDEGRA